jgi:hypothetical protein
MYFCSGTPMQFYSGVDIALLSRVVSLSILGGVGRWSVWANAGDGANADIKTAAVKKKRIIVNTSARNAPAAAELIQIRVYVPNTFASGDY